MLGGAEGGVCLATCHFVVGMLLTERRFERRNFESGVIVRASAWCSSRVRHQPVSCGQTFARKHAASLMSQQLANPSLTSSVIITWRYQLAKFDGFSLLITWRGRHLFCLQSSDTVLYKCNEYIILHSQFLVPGLLLLELQISNIQYLFINMQSLIVQLYHLLIPQSSFPTLCCYPPSLPPSLALTFPLTLSPTLYLPAHERSMELLLVTHVPGETPVVSSLLTATAGGKST